MSVSWRAIKTKFVVCCMPTVEAYLRLSNASTVVKRRSSNWLTVTVLQSGDLQWKTAHTNGRKSEDASRSVDSVARRRLLRHGGGWRCLQLMMLITLSVRAIVGHNGARSSSRVDNSSTSPWRWRWRWPVETIGNVSLTV